jgi:phosphoglycerol transferase MdoB-like AlkP superfamily enzyme
MTKNTNHSNPKKEKTILKAIGSVLFAIIASSHHWLHTLLIALGLTTLGTSLLAMPPSIRLVFLLISLTLSIWFIRVARKRWNRNRPAAWVYLISSLISIILVFTAIPDSISSFNQPDPVQQQEPQQLPEQDHDHNSHSEL